jgi:hypothetical protein
VHLGVFAGIDVKATLDREPPFKTTSSPPFLELVFQDIGPEHLLLLEDQGVS